MTTPKPRAQLGPTLTDFLLARIAEKVPVPVPVDEGGGYYHSTYRHAGTCGLLDAWGDRECTCNGAARVLAECEAKRRIVEEHTPKHPHGNPLWPESCRSCADAIGYDGNWQDYPCPTLRFLALPYADHPEYREEWKP